MFAALRILGTVLVVRLRRFEMANLAAAVSIMVALGTALPALLLRTLFALLLNVLVYALNDTCDVERDLAGGRDLPRTRYLLDHRRAAVGGLIGLALLLTGFALAWNVELLVPAVVGTSLCWWYSAVLKRHPYVDVAAMAACGVAMPLVAIPLDSLLGWKLLVQLGLFSAVFETLQVLRDREPDAAVGLRTTAVVLGDRRTLWLARGLMLASAAYGALALERWLGLIPAAAAFLPWLPEARTRYWNHVRLVLGVGWLALLTWVFLTGAGGGPAGSPGGP